VFVLRRKPEFTPTASLFYSHCSFQSCAFYDRNSLFSVSW